MEDYAEQTKRVIQNVESGQSWHSFYQAIRTESSKNNYTCGEAKAPGNSLLNRYRDVSPYDHSRVILQNGPCDYINASLVKVEKAGRNYILTQGALPHTSGHFWLMVWEQKSKAILMLNKVIEKNQIKCHQYWPVGSSNGASSVMDFDDVSLRVHLLSEEERQHFIIRTLVIEEMSTGNKREVMQFHYTTWPDFGVPTTPRAFLHFLQIVRDADVLSSKFGPAVVHCSAGIGRSGTFCLVDSCLLMMENGLEVNIKDVLLEMRKYRLGLIQTPDQLRFSYLAILEGCQQLANGNKKFLPDLDENGVNGTTEEAIPNPPSRIDSLPRPTQDQFKRFIEGLAVNDEIQRNVADRPLPPIPISSSSDEDSSGEDLIDYDDDEDGDEDETASTSYGLLDHVNTNDNDQSPVSLSERKSSVSEVENIREDEDSIRPETILSSNHVADNESAQQQQHQSNGVDENELRRRKNEATREKIREIRAKQKETEARQGLYRSLTDTRLLLGVLGVSAVAIFYFYVRSTTA